MPRRLEATCLSLALLIGPALGGEDRGRQAEADLDLAQGVSRTQARAVARVAPAIVSVRALSDESEEYGAGIVVDRSGKVLTALHVVRGALGVSVRFQDDGTDYPARICATDPQADLALLEVSGIERELEVATWGRDRELRPGMQVLAVGNPYDLGGSVSSGVVSAVGRRYVIRDNSVPLLQTDAAINPGSSGGALVNLEGAVVGMVTAILTEAGGGHRGIGFAVPAGEIRHALPYLLCGEPVSRAWLGIRARERLGGGPGVEITEVVAGGPAARAGVRRGDLLTGLHGTPLRGLRDLRTYMRAIDVGERVRLNLERNGGRLEIEVEAAHLREKT